MRNPWPALLVGLAVLTGVATPPAAAQEVAEGVMLSPAPDSERRDAKGTFAELGELAPGQTVREAVVVRSTFATDREVVLYPADAVPAVGGGFGFDDLDDERDQVGAWITLEKDRILLPAGGSVRVGYTLTVPERVQGGEYVGGILAQPVAVEQSAGVATLTRFGMSVYLRVPGGAAGATPGRGSPDGRFVLEEVELVERDEVVCPRVTYRNESQDIIDPVLRVEADGALTGSRAQEEKGGAVLPDGTVTSELSCIRRPIGPGTVTVEAETPRGGGRETVSTAWLPWPFVLALIALVLLGLALLLLLLRGIRRRGHGSGRSTA